MSTIERVTDLEKTPNPDLVDRAAVAERLGVRASTVSRWYRRSMLPQPDLRIGSEDVWLWKTVHDWSGSRGRSIPALRLPDRDRVPDVVDVAEIARRLRVTGRTAAAWHRSGLMPEPDYRLASTDAWLWENIEKWARASVGRTPGLARPRHVVLPTGRSEFDGPHLRLPYDASGSWPPLRRRRRRR